MDRLRITRVVGTWSVCRCYQITDDAERHMTAWQRVQVQHCDQDRRQPPRFAGGSVSPLRRTQPRSQAFTVSVTLPTSGWTSSSRWSKKAIERAAKGAAECELMPLPIRSPHFQSSRISHLIQGSNLPAVPISTPSGCPFEGPYVPKTGRWCIGLSSLQTGHQQRH